MTNKKQYLLTIIIPTFNEFENVDKIIEKLKKVLYNRISYKIIFVDDNSNDGTSDKIKQYQKENSNIELILRIGRRGLAGACIEGIQNSESKYVAIMDCDLQHDEKLLIEMLNELKNNNLDLVIGSRYVENGDE